MELSYWGQIGAAVGFVLALINYLTFAWFFAPKMRERLATQTAEERASTERHLNLMRWVFLVGFPLFMVAGYIGGSDLGR